MRQLSTAEVHAKSVSALGLDAEAVDMASPEAIACVLRRTAGFLCPCAPSRIVGTVVSALDGLVDDLEEVRVLAEETIQSLIALGDLIEDRPKGDSGVGGGTQIYAAPPAFVARQSGAFLLLGIVPDGGDSLSEELEGRIEYINHTRRIIGDEDLGAQLQELGLVELPQQAWLRAPRQETAAECIGRFGIALDRSTPSGDIPGLTLLDPDTSNRFYKGRWRQPTSRTGRFVARRSQLYGSPIWCYVEIERGLPKKLLDLPLQEGGFRGCDEAWQLQAAIDAERGEPQVFRLRFAIESEIAVEFFSPVPAFARRRWDAIGELLASRRGCLFVYRFAADEMNEERAFMRDRLWLAELN